MYLGGDESLTSLKWLDEHVRKSHGPLGALYPAKTWTEPNPNGALKEGDTPSWFYFRRIALQNPAQPDWGGWGGRFRNAGHGLWRDVPDMINGEADARASVWRWRLSFQREFQARLDWCVEDVAHANHPPEIEMDGSPVRSPVVRTAKAGRRLTVSVRAIDRDEDSLTYQWWIYADAGTYAQSVRLTNEKESAVHIDVPADAAGGSLHLIVEVTDDGSPALTAQARFVLNVEK